MYFGGDYNPEQWPEEVWDDDVVRMREAKVNLVSLGIFSWARIQPDEDTFDFAWLDRIIDKLHTAGIGVDLATATASPPAWMVRRYPDIVPVDERGVRLGFGSRQHYAATSPDYRRLAAGLVRALARRYAAHPAVLMWHVNNEYACHIPADYSLHAERAFRSWLITRYGDIEAVNASWGTDFWSQRYTDFEEIDPPRISPTTQHPAKVLDFRRFTSDSVLELYTMERDILRSEGALQPILTNFMGAFKPLDYWRWAQEVDIVTDDSYPDPRDPDAVAQGGFVRDLMRSLKPDRPWILMEQAPNAVQWRPNNAAKKPGQMAAWSEQAVARGAEGVMFFQWRQSRYGQEKFHSAMLPHAGRVSRTWQEIVRLGSSLAGRSTSRPLRGSVAIVFDWQNWWALDQPDLPADVDYNEQAFGWYRALHRRNVQVSFVRSEDDLAGFRLVVAPALYLLSEEGAASLEEFVEQGGTLVTTALTDIVDSRDQFRPEGFGVQIAAVLGGQPIDFAGLEPADGERVVVGDQSFSPTIMREDFQLSTGSSLGSYVDGSVAVVANSFGHGTSLHATSFAEGDYLDWLLGWAIEKAAVEPVLPGLPDGVEAIQSDQGVVLINHSSRATTVDAGVAGAVELGAFETLHL